MCFFIKQQNILFLIDVFCIICYNNKWGFIMEGDMKKSVILILAIVLSVFLFSSSEAYAFKFSSKIKDTLVHGSEKSSPLGSTLKKKTTNEVNQTVTNEANKTAN